jgi:hypothetical protein
MLMVDTEATYSVSCDVFPLDVDANHAADYNIGISDEMGAGHVVAMRLVRDSYDAVDPAFERHRRVCDTRRPN